MNHPGHSEFPTDRPAGSIAPVCPTSGGAVLRRAGAGDRLVAGAVALLAWSVLAVAAALTPSDSGEGTHRQLGLPACSTKVLMGRPCPSCGMTTAFAFFVRGELLDALRAQVFGTILAALTLLTALGGTVMAGTGVHFGPVLGRMFMGRHWWLWALGGLALGSWGLKAATGW